MSIGVAVENLATTLADYPWGYVLTVSDHPRAHMSSVPTNFVDGRFVVDVGRSTRDNAAARPDVTLLFPPADGTGYSLIVDGTAEVGDDVVTITPTKAVLHRPAL